MKRRIPYYHIVYEDADILVVYKERDLFTIRTSDPKTSYSNLYRFLEMELSKKGERPYLVHRLDYETSGLLIFAKRLEIQQKLQSCFETRNVVRKYEAVVAEKLPSEQHYDIRQFLTSNGKGGRVYLTDELHGKEAITHIVTKNPIQIGTALSISIETGRRAQIRLAIASLGWHLLGDNKYSKTPAKRMYLNAYELEFPRETGLKQYYFKVSPLWLKP